MSFKHLIVSPPTNKDILKPSWRQHDTWLIDEDHYL